MSTDNTRKRGAEEAAVVTSSSDRESCFDPRMDENDEIWNTMASTVEVVPRAHSCNSLEYDFEFQMHENDEAAKNERELMKLGQCHPRTPQGNDVCFKMQKGKDKGTDEWRECVNSYAQANPKFTREIYREVRTKLGYDRRYLICFDDDGKPSDKINDQWYLAKEEEILEKTRQRFNDEHKKLNRQVLEVATTVSGNVEARRGPGRPRKRPRSVSMDVATMPSSPEEAWRKLKEAVTNFRIVKELQEASPELFLPAPESDDEDAASTLLDDLQWTGEYVRHRVLSSGGNSAPLEAATLADDDDAED